MSRGERVDCSAPRFGDSGDEQKGAKSAKGGRAGAASPGKGTLADVRLPEEGSGTGGNGGNREGFGAPQPSPFANAVREWRQQRGSSAMTNDLDQLRLGELHLSGTGQVFRGL